MLLWLQRKLLKIIKLLWGSLCWMLGMLGTAGVVWVRKIVHVCCRRAGIRMRPTTLWAKLFLFSATVHLCFLFMVLFVYKGDSASYVIDINKQMDADALVVFLPLQKKVHEQSTAKKGRISGHAKQRAASKPKKVDAQKVAKQEKGPTSLVCEDDERARELKKEKARKAAEKKKKRLAQKKREKEQRDKAQQEKAKQREAEKRLKAAEEAKKAEAEKIKREQQAQAEKARQDEINKKVQQDELKKQEDARKEQELKQESKQQEVGNRDFMQNGQSVDDMRSTDTSIEQQVDGYGARNIIYIGQEDLDALQIQQELSQAVSKHWRPPAGISKDRVCQLTLVIGWDGMIKDSKISRSSGAAMYDVSARSAARAAHYPKALWGKECTITFKQ